MVIEFEWLSALLDDPVAHDDDLIGHGHGLDLVVGHINRRGLQALMERLDFGSHLDPELGV